MRAKGPREERARGAAAGGDAWPGGRCGEVRYYNVLGFENAFEGVRFCRRVRDVLGANGAGGRSASPSRAVLWIAPADTSSPSVHVYASDDALDAAATAGVDAPIAGYVWHTELPPSRCLYLGDAESPSEMDERARSAALLSMCLQSARAQDAPNAVHANDRARTAVRGELF